MAISGSSTVAYRYDPRHTEAGVVVQQRSTTTAASMCSTADEATADLYVLKPTMVQGSDAAQVNEWIRAQGWRMEVMP